MRGRWTALFVASAFLANGDLARSEATLPPVAAPSAVTPVAAPAVGKPAPAQAPAGASPASPGAIDAELAHAVDALVNRHSLADADIGVEIMEVDTGRVLAAHSEHAPLNPASNAKVVTAAAALAMLHGDHRYQTTLSGTTKSGAVAGNLLLRGHGDPSLETEDVYGLALELRAHGIRRIDGDIVVDQKFHDDQPIPPGFEQKPSEWATFRAPISAVAVNENTVMLTVKPSHEPGGTAQVSFDPPGFVDFEGTVKTTDAGSDNVILALAPSGQRLSARVAGTVSTTSKVVRYTRRVDDPTLLAGFVLRDALEQVGIKVNGHVTAGTSKANNVIVVHESAPLSQLLYSVGKNSDNFYAEMIFKSISGELHNKPAKSADSAELITKWLEKQGLMEPGVVIKNGSGLYDANRLTPHLVVSLLRVVYRDPTIAPEYVAQLAIGGVDGTLHKRFGNRAQHRAIRAKTGTLDDVIALSGFVIGPPGKSPIAFSVLCNHVAGKGGAAREGIDALVRTIYDRQWGAPD